SWARPPSRLSKPGGSHGFQFGSTAILRRPTGDPMHLRRLLIALACSSAPLAAQGGSAQPAARPIATATSISQARWLEGCWSRPEARGGETTERWHAAEGGSMFGMSRLIRGDTVRSYELFHLTVRGGRMGYTAHLATQMPVTFTASFISDTALVFENPKH